MLNSHGYLNNASASVRQVAQPYRPRGRRMRDGQCAAALRAITAAQGYLSGTFPTLNTAANCCGSNAAYVAAAVTVLKADDAALIGDVLQGAVPLMKAAASVSNAVRMIEAFKKGSSFERRIFGRVAGPAAVFDHAVVAAL
jgi:hypothetical protein